MERRGWKSVAGYVGLLAAALAVAMAGSWRFGAPLDNAAYDYMFRRYQPKAREPQSVLLAIDERTLDASRGMYHIRRPLAEALRLVASASPKAVALDVILAESRDDSEGDTALAQALCATPRLALSTPLIDDGQAWEDPLPQFKNCAAALGHVHAQPDRHDTITRSIPLVKRAGRDRRWALSLEAFRLSRGDVINESSSDSNLQVGRTVIPIPDSRFGPMRAEDTENRPMRVRFLLPGMTPIPRVSLKALLDDHRLASRFAGKVVFVGGTAVTLADNRLLTPARPYMQITGIEIHAEAFETMAQGLFITDVSDVWVLVIALGLVTAAGLAFRFLPGWRAYAAGILVIVAAQLIPYVFFTRQRVLSFSATVSAAWLGTLTAAAYYHLVVRRRWLAEQATRARYQQAMHFVTHEMRTPLSSIQGSSELISRFALTEEKRKQIAQVIHSESKRLARMVEIFLNVERLSAGQMELKREPIAVAQMLALCVERTSALAERKHIAIRLQPIAEDLQLTGDRELMEYACYNLLTNAVKYSPQRTEVTVSAWRDGRQIRIAVKDQGMGMDQKEVRQIFQKFYRTRKAEQSGEAGSGIGLAIVQQIVEQHGGEIEVMSQPGAGSCFTLVMPAAQTREPAAAERR